VKIVASRIRESTTWTNYSRERRFLKFYLRKSFLDYEPSLSKVFPSSQSLANIRDYLS